MLRYLRLAAHGLDEPGLFLIPRSDRVYDNGRQHIEVTLRVVPAADLTFTDEQHACSAQQRFDRVRTCPGRIRPAAP